jgi:S-adenosylmethionine-diacylglycerol 3-amino-3-carboxypropyl transferase
MDAALPGWVADAAALPVAFAQVREDPLLDEWVVQQLPPRSRMIMIASGGCTLAYLAGHANLAHIDVVDANPAQLALARVKLNLLQTANPDGRLALLGHLQDTQAVRRMLGRTIRDVIPTIGRDLASLSPDELWIRDGLDHIGRYERVFRQLRVELHDVASEVESLLRLRDPDEQAGRVQPGTNLGRALDQAFDRALDLPILVRLFGEGATRNRVEPFARHFARRTRHVLATLPAAENPYLWQVLRGSYPPDHPAPWIARAILTHLPVLTWTQSAMTDALRKSPGNYDFVHLSNILDWLSPEEARATLDLTHAALKPGGWVLIRQLNSAVDIPAAGPHFGWLDAEAKMLHARDRSFFYRALHVGRKR